MCFRYRIVTILGLSKLPRFLMKLAAWVTAASLRLAAESISPWLSLPLSLPFMCSQVIVSKWNVSSSGPWALWEEVEERQQFREPVEGTEGRGPVWWHDSPTFLDRWMRRQCLWVLCTYFTRQSRLRPSNQLFWLHPSDVAKGKYVLLLPFQVYP